MRIFTTSTTMAATLTLAAAVLAACGQDDGQGAGAYCSELKTDKAYFQTFNSPEPDLSELDEVFTRMHSLARVAPAAVEKPWATLDGAVTTIEDALHEAGLSVDDLVAIQRGEIPDDVDLDKLTELGPKMEALGGPEVDDAATRIATHAKDECGVDLQAV